MGKRRWTGDHMKTESPPSKLKAPPHIRALQDKTISMLFEGANRKNQNFEEKNHVKNGCNNTVNHMKQMRIDSHGRLFFNGVVEEPRFSGCSVCKLNIGDEIVQCSYCEVSQCVLCAKICCACKMPTCNSCSVNADGDFDQVLCFNCCR